MNLGGSEILVIIFVALMIFGPDKLPSALRTFGRVMGEVRKYQDMAKREIEKAVASASFEEKTSSEQETKEIEEEKTEQDDSSDSTDESQSSRDLSGETVAPILDEDES